MRSSAPYAVIGGLYLWFALGHGVPALRQDWLWPLATPAFVSRMLDLSIGWSSTGLGQAYPYPMTYFVLWPLLVFGVVFGSRAALALLLIAVSCSATWLGFQIARVFQLPNLAACALGVFLLFNPWSYNKLVAGHLTQTIAYIGLTLVLLECLGHELAPRRLIVAVLLAALQIQFFLIALAVTAMRARNVVARRAIIVGVLVFSPTIIGIVLEQRDLLAWPFLVSWEASQSVPLSKAIFLQGYFAHYAGAAFAGVSGTGVWAFLAMAFVALAVKRDATSYRVAGVIAAAMLVASGTTGALGTVWKWAIVHAPVVGVYRELYDLVAVAAGGYALLAAVTMARLPATRWLAIAAATAMVVAWFHFPPSRYWVAAEELPAAGSQLAHAQRYALMPPFQPLSYNGRGSGADTLYIGDSASNVPINALSSTFPADAALSQYQRTGDASGLARLGVDLIECRQRFSEALGARLLYGAPQGQVGRGCLASEVREVRVPDPAPIVSLERVPRICSLCRDAGEGNIFFADVSAAASKAFNYKAGSWFQPVSLQRIYAAPELGWVDARLVFAEQPGLAQPLGGAYTSDPRAQLMVPSAPYALVNVSGDLTGASGRLLARDTRGFRWVAVPQGTRALGCRGRCLVAGFGDPAHAALNPPPPRFTRIDFHFYAPWLVGVGVPAGPAGVLRFLETFDAGWAAIEVPRMRYLDHIRLDAALNGWIVEARASAYRIVLVQVPALLEILFGFVGMSYATFMLIRMSTAGDRRTAR